jgi:parallel beta-helix repeat protein
MISFSEIPYIEFIPIGAIGIWRWSMWAFKKIAGHLTYKVTTTECNAKVSLITPVYNEEPEILLNALQSWQKEKPDEIIVVVDYSDESSIKILKKFCRKKENKNARYIITMKPGKREALVTGMKEAKHEIIALVDADTEWTPDVLKNALAPFADEKVGGVATRQNVTSPNSLTRVLFDILLDLRYFDEMPFLSGMGDALSCLSGRTAFYRTSAVTPLLEALQTETFMGKKCISGDDKCLTFLVQGSGWKTVYQSNAIVLTPGTDDFQTFAKQKIRWARNSWRADTKALSSKWIKNNPYLLFFIADKFIAPFTMIYGFAFFAVALAYGHFVQAGILLIWWLVTRTIKILPNLRRCPKNIIYIPAYIVYSYWSAMIRIFALVTINTQGWLTRWDISRMSKTSIIQSMGAYIYTIYIILIIAAIPFFHFKHQSEQSVNKKMVIAQNLKEDVALNTKDITADIDQLNKLNTEPSLVRREVQKGDSLSQIAAEYKIPVSEIVKFNFAILPNWDRINPGDILTIPVKPVKYEPLAMFNYQRKSVPARIQTYDAATNTINVTGRGQKYTIEEIAAADGYKHLVKESDGVWILKSNLYLQSGTSLNIYSPEVSWLKMESGVRGYSTIIAYNSRVTIRDTKITSWNPDQKDFDTDYHDGRSYILVKANSRMDIYNSELAYLGYKEKDLTTAGGTYGVSWRIPSKTYPNYLVTGEVLNSNFNHNYFGAYTYGATGIIWKENKFNDNVVYGLDPHDDSNTFIVENNIAQGNGTHGIIFSKRCYNNIIVNNISTNNGLHGIMLHQDSNNNIIRNNNVENNKDGIAIWASTGNLIENNKVKNNVNGIRLNERSNKNYVLNNEVNTSAHNGLFVYADSNENIFRSNKLTDNMNATYIKTNNNEISLNNITNNKTAIYLLDKASNNFIISNELSANVVATKIKTVPDVLNFYKLTNLLSSNN